MNNFLKTRIEVDTATKYLQDNNLVESGLSCKNWEAVQVLPLLKDGVLLDMGSSGGIILENAGKLGIQGKKFGIDLAYAGKVFNLTDDGILFVWGDLMNTPFESNLFDVITCLSVIEHEVNFERFAKEVNRLLKSGGNAFVSFDFWEPKPAYEKRKLYNLDWNILDTNDVFELIKQFSDNGMEVTSGIDWTLQDAVINKFYCAPTDVEYTFGILNFIKK